MSYWNVLPNDTLAAVQHRNLTKVGGVTYSADEQAFAEQIRATLISPGPALGSQAAVQPLRSDLVGAATFVPGVPAHSWQAVACAGSSIGIKGMIVAGKAMALTAADLYSDTAIIEAAKEELRRRRGGAAFQYTTLAPPKPPLDYRR
jgi:aminobenzoyl-glutamate utilization protein B